MVRTKGVTVEKDCWTLLPLILGRAEKKKKTLDISRAIIHWSYVFTYGNDGNEISMIEPQLYTSFAWLFLLVWAQACRIHHHMGNVCLFMCGMKKMGKRTLGKDAHIIPSVGLATIGSSRWIFHSEAIEVRNDIRKVDPPDLTRVRGIWCIVIVESSAVGIGECCIRKAVVLVKTAVPKFQSIALLSQNSRDIFFLLMATELALRS